MYVFLVALMIVYVIVGVWVCITEHKARRLKVEMIDDLVKQNDLLIEQNRLLRGIIKKFGLNISD